VTLLLWPLLAFGGGAASTAIAFALFCLTLALIIRPHVGNPLDLSLLLLTGSVFLQLVPFPFTEPISPHARLVREALVLAPGPARMWLPLTVDVKATAWAALELAGTVALFLVARDRFNVHGVRRTTRAIAAIGFGISALALAQAATAGHSIYWRYSTPTEGPLPLGPFANRNHFATWAIMALPLCAGYIVARADAHHRPVGRLDPNAPVLDLRDDRTLWLAVSISMMLAGLLLALSWSASVATAIAALGALLFVRRSLHIRRWLALIALHVVLVALALGLIATPWIRDRIAGPDTGAPYRMATWHETVPLVRDFIATGTGAGTYELAMRVYQRSERQVYFNQAQNHYLQIAAEGGLLVGLPFVLALVAFARTARERLAGDRSGVWWIRLGAASGLAAVAIQSLFETGLTLTANAALAAVLAALVVHRREN
jgi:hypothetical protein